MHPVLIPTDGRGHRMGVELYITRAQFWADNDECQITPEEWLQYVSQDPEFRLDPRNGDYHALWLGKSQYEEPWLDWFQGNINTKWPDTALYNKMLVVASALKAKIQDDDGTEYSKVGDWVFNPKGR
jgi:hypothetical protein